MKRYIVSTTEISQNKIDHNSKYNVRMTYIDSDTTK